MVQNADGIWLHQKQYKKFGLMDAKPVSTPADSNVRLMKDDGVRNHRLVIQILIELVIMMIDTLPLVTCLFLEVG